MISEPAKTNRQVVDKKILAKAYELMCTARAMSDLYEEKSQITQKYVHATSPIIVMTVFCWELVCSRSN